MPFKHEMGVEAESLSTGMKGILVSRSENLYGCNRYYIQPKSKDNKLVEGCWHDEDDLVIKSSGITKKVPARKNTGGPVSKIR